LHGPANCAPHVFPSGICFRTICQSSRAAGARQMRTEVSRIALPPPPPARLNHLWVRRICHVEHTNAVPPQAISTRCPTPANLETSAWRIAAPLTSTALCCPPQSTAARTLRVHPSPGAVSCGRSRCR
jgi:hypothetical protein